MSAGKSVASSLNHFIALCFAYIYVLIFAFVCFFLLLLCGLIHFYYVLWWLFSSIQIFIKPKFIFACPTAPSEKQEQPLCTLRIFVSTYFLTIFVLFSHMTNRQRTSVSRPQFSLYRYVYTLFSLL